MLEGQCQPSANHANHFPTLAQHMLAIWVSTTDKLKITKQYKYFLQRQKQNKSLLNEYLFKTNHRQRNFPAARHIYMINPCLSSLIKFSKYPSVVACIQRLSLSLLSRVDASVPDPQYCPDTNPEMERLLILLPNSFIQSKIPTVNKSVKRIFIVNSQIGHNTLNCNHV